MLMKIEKKLQDDFKHEESFFVDGSFHASVVGFVVSFECF